MATKNMVVIHHSATDDSGTVSWAAIEKYHRETNGWKDIGYHWGVELVTSNQDLDKYKFQALVGRPEEEDGAAVKEGMVNQHGIHVCCVGDFDKVAPKKEMLEVLVNRVVVPAMRRWGIRLEGIRMHREFAPYKTCPGKKFPIDVVKQMVRERITR